MSPVSKGFIGLVLWLFVGFGVTEIAALSLNAYFMHDSISHRPSDSLLDTVAALKSDEPM